MLGTEVPLGIPAGIKLQEVLSPFRRVLSQLLGLMQASTENTFGCNKTPVLDITQQANSVKIYGPLNGIELR